MAIDWDALVLAPTMAAFGEGVPVVYRTAGGTQFLLTHAVFDHAYTQVVLLDDGSEISTTKPCLGVRLALFPVSPRQGDSVAIASTGKTYSVTDVRPDGHGHARLILVEGQ